MTAHPHEPMSEKVRAFLDGFLDALPWTLGFLAGLVFALGLLVGLWLA